MIISNYSKIFYKPEIKKKIIIILRRILKKISKKILIFFDIFLP